MKVDIFNTEKKYDIIYADPPWEYRNMGNIQATAASHYSTMKQADIDREDKFERKWWVDNRAKRVWVRFEKRANRRKFRRMTKVQGEDKNE